jgi:hypothetical protein
MLLFARSQLHARHRVHGIIGVSPYPQPNSLPNVQTPEDCYTSKGMCGIARSGSISFCCFLVCQLLRTVSAIFRAADIPLLRAA